MTGTTYTIEYKKSVEKELHKLPSTQLSGIVAKIRALAADPHSVGSVKLRSSSDLFRIRHADCRVIYQVHDKKLILLVIKVGHRREVYREL